MRNAIATALCLLTLTANASSARRRAVAMPVREDLTLSFTRSLIDAGTIAHRGPADGNATRTTQDVGIRIESRSNTSRRAILRASLTSPDPQVKVRIDGVTLGPLPAVIDARALVGATTTHHIEIEVSTAAAEGALLTSISWEAETP